MEKWVVHYCFFRFLTQVSAITLCLWHASPPEIWVGWSRQSRKKATAKYGSTTCAVLNMIYFLKGFQNAAHSWSHVWNCAKIEEGGSPCADENSTSGKGFFSPGRVQNHYRAAWSPQSYEVHTTKKEGQQIIVVLGDLCLSTLLWDTRHTTWRYDVMHGVCLTRGLLIWITKR